MKKINLKIEGKDKEYSLEENSPGIRLGDIAKEFCDEHKGYITLAVVDNKLKELNCRVKKDCEINFLDTTNEDGERVYFRVMSFIFVMACRENFWDSRVTIEHSLSDGLYCEVHIDRKLKEADVENIKNKMKEIVNNDYVIEKIEVTRNEAISIFENNEMYEKAELLKYKEYDSAKVYKCRNYIDHFYGYMLPSTGYIKSFDIKLYNGGVIILGPSEEDKTLPMKFVPQPKLSSVYYEAEEWSRLMGIDKVVSLNKIIENNEYGDIIRTFEALHEKKLSQIADMIKDGNKRVILIAAPSSSGKTSFAHRLSIHLRVNNLNPISISLDDYFIDRKHTPLDEYGNYDFESIYAIDLEKFNLDLKKLLAGEEIDDIRFNFKEGKREYTGKKIKIDSNQPIILEGIHGLNPILTSSIPDEDKFKIYISALTQINLDDHNRIPTADLRMIRRIVRDYNFRGYSADNTILQWASVRRGEKKNIFPYQEEADAIFNSACVYELAVLKRFAKPLLEEIKEDNPAHIEATRLLKFLQYFVELDDTSDIPGISILREFIGGSKIVD
ncbi:AAA family ATPase [Clostridioides difficile]|uniref:nucleoside kinase n=1 Tax=Clostridioides difficile TaxID=1496 RepID=UPI0028A30C28|nr:nucleoside kinase [Clostridioides difficile]KAK2229065.1 AAA family ATPase [Clostridioides difficile]KAK2311732.1 AAA family ATPase [Clostridioides difficile]